MLLGRSEQILMMSRPTCLRLPRPGSYTESESVPEGADSIAALSEGRKLLIFPLEQVPEMGRGRGVTLQKSKNDRLSDAQAFKLAEGLPWGNRTIPANELKFWRGERAQAGRMPEKGWPRAKRFKD